MSLFCLSYVLIIWMLLSCSKGGVVVVASSPSPSSSAENRTLVWRPKNTGVFSQFFQLKYLNKVAREYSRKLIIEAFVSPVHFGKNAIISMCSIFALSSSNISCIVSNNITDKSTEALGGRKSKITKGPLKKKVSLSCSNQLRKQFLTLNSSEVCFNGVLFGSTGLVPLRHRMSIVALDSPILQFTSMFMDLYSRLLYPELLRLARKISTSARARDGEWTVVHWRRGDQLATRCLTDSWRGLKDYSMNCASAQDMLIDVRKDRGGNLSEVVFVATNEKNASILNVLRGSKDVYLLNDVISSLFGGTLPELNQFILEVVAMLNSHYLITFGISNINDLVEDTRRRLNKTFCVKDEKGNADNWCHHYMNDNVKTNKKTTGRDREKKIKSKSAKLVQRSAAVKLAMINK